MTKSTITREPITHDLKIYPEFFSAVCTGVKRAELRKNDRDYRVGDTLHLMETPRGSCHRTGEFINVTITHIADVGEWMPGYVLLSVELQEGRKADSEPVFTLEVSQADYKGQKLGNHFGFITLDAARELKEGNYQLYTAQPAPVVPDDVLEALQKVARIRLDMNDFDGDRRGIADCLCDAEEALIEMVNRRAAMLAAAPQPQNAQQNIPEIIPNELIAAVNRLLDSNGSRGCYNAIKCYDAHIEVERLLAAARQEDANALIPVVSRNEPEGK